MKSIKLIFVLVLSFVFSLPVNAQQTDSQIRQQIIKESIQHYSGSCPCPYSRDRAGRKCGKRSAYSKPGGANPYCYESDIPDSVVEEIKKKD